MPTRKTVTTVEEQAPQDVEVVEIDEIEEAAESALDGLLAEFSGADDVVVNVYRQGEGKNISFLFKTMPEEMNGGDIMERCRDQFGTGDYRMHVRKGPRILANRSFSVEAPVKPEYSNQPQQFGTAELMAIMTKQNENTQTMFANMMTAVATMFSGAHQNQPVINPVEMQNSLLQGVMTMKQMAEPENKGPDAVTMLIKGMELAGSMAPKSGDTNMNDIFLKAVEAFPALAQATKAVGPSQRIPPPNQRPAYVVPKDTVKTDMTKPLPSGEFKTMPAQNPAPTENSEAETIKMQIRANLQYLCRLAAQDRDPQLYAEVIIDQMGKEAVLEFIGHDDALQKLTAIEPTVNLYPGWFNNLKAAILELTGDETEPETELSEGDAIVDDSTVVELTSDVVLDRINASGLRREGQKDAPVRVPATEPDTPDTVWNGRDSEPASDT